MSNTNTASKVYHLFNVATREDAEDIRKAKGSTIESGVLTAFASTPAAELRTATMRAHLRLKAEAGRALSEKREAELGKDKEAIKAAHTVLHARLRLANACLALHDKIVGVRLWQSPEPFRAETRRLLNASASAKENADEMARAFGPVIETVLDRMTDAMKTVAEARDAEIGVLAFTEIAELRKAVEGVGALVQANIARDAEVAELRKAVGALAAALDHAVISKGGVIEHVPAPGVIEAAAAKAAEPTAPPAAKAAEPTAPPAVQTKRLRPPKA